MGVAELKWLALAMIMLIVLCLLPVRVSLRFYRSPTEFNVILRLTIWFFSIMILPQNFLTRFFWSMSKNRFWKKTAPRDLRAREIDWKRMYYRYRLMMIMSRLIFNRANLIFQKIAQPVNIREINLYTEIGLGDAAVTALSTGTLWAAQGYLLNLLGARFNMQKTKKHLSIQPNFQMNNHLLMDYSCIFEMRIGHIIIIIYQMLRKAKLLTHVMREVSQ